MILSLSTCRGMHEAICSLLCTMTTMTARDAPETLQSLYDGAFDMVLGELQDISSDAGRQNASFSPSIPSRKACRGNTQSICDITMQRACSPKHFCCAPTDCHQIVRLMCAPGALPAGTTATVAFFQHACLAASADDAKVYAEASEEAKQTPPERIKRCSVSVHTIKVSLQAGMPAITFAP